MNKISIITINRNNASGLQQTIESVISQTYTDYEFIVIDGASTDGSKDVIDKYSNSITYFVSEADTGIYNAMNKGILKSTGDYCYFLNSGDCLASADTLNTIFNEVRYSAPFINGHQINIINGVRHRASAKNRNLSLYDFYWGTIKHQATFIKRDLFDKYGLYDESLKITSDWKFFLETIGIHNEQPIYVDVDIILFPWEGISTNKAWIEIHEQERKEVLNSFFSKSIQADYETLHNLKNYEYLAQLMKSNTLFSKLVRILVKIFK